MDLPQILQNWHTNQTTHHSGMESIKWLGPLELKQRSSRSFVRRCSSSPVLMPGNTSSANSAILIGRKCVCLVCLICFAAWASKWHLGYNIVLLYRQRVQITVEYAEKTVSTISKWVLGPREVARWTTNPHREFRSMRADRTPAFHAFPSHEDWRSHHSPLGFLPAMTFVLTVSYQLQARAW